MNEIDLAAALFSPRAVALVGASGDPAKNTARPLRLLEKHGYPGRVVPVNARRAEVLGHRAYPNVEAAPGPIDHAFVMVPGEQVADVVAACGRAGIPLATVYSDGFAEAGPEGVARQTRLLETARAAGVRLVGPNSMGVLDAATGMALTVNAALDRPALSAGPIAIVSQSGSVMGALLSRGHARGLGFSKAVSVGNEADLGVGEIVDLLVDDARTEVVLLFLESLRRSTALGAAARRAHAAGKPIIAYKLGRSPVGRSLATSHSGAITGGVHAARAFFRAHGILEVEMLESLLELPALLGGRRPAAGRRAAVLTTTGGGAAMVVDRLGTHGVDVVPPPEALASMLAGHGVRVPSSPILDLTMAGARAEVYRTALDGLMAAPEIDVVVAVVGSSGEFHPQVAVEPIVAAEKRRPLAVFIAPQADASLALLAEAGIAGFRTPEACADAVRAYLDWRVPVDAPAAARDLGPVRDALAAGGEVFDEAQAAGVFAALGIEQAPSRVVREPGEPVDLAYPLAVKAIVAGLAHKTETGAVVLDVADADALAAACRAMRERLAGEALAGFLVQQMQRGLAEALVGYRDDPEVGPTVVVGVGGTLTELYRDVAVRLAPVGLETAREMIAEVRGLAPLRGYRRAPGGAPLGDVEALARAVVALSDLARLEGGPVAEAEINPLIVRPAGQGAVAVDALLVAKPR